MDLAEERTFLLTYRGRFGCRFCRREQKILSVLHPETWAVGGGPNRYHASDEKPPKARCLFLGPALLQWHVGSALPNIPCPALSSEIALLVEVDPAQYGVKLVVVQ
jgi:hypothetical protein